MKEWIILVLFLVLASGNCEFAVEKCSLKVTSPESLKGEYKSSMGNFGIPDYGGTLAGLVTYYSANNDSCISFQDLNVSKHSPGGLPTFLLADRGGCYFTVKAWNAQNGGAAAILVANNEDGEFITMDIPDGGGADGIYIQNITIPSALISKSLGDNIKKALSNNEMVRVNLDWTESLPHKDDRVECEFWTNSNYECGVKCDAQIDFVRNFKGAAQILEQKGYTQFTPHYITWYCPKEYLSTRECKSQCINNGRYCAPDPEQDLTTGYDGKEVVLQNLRQACFFKVVSELKKPWLWWDYVTDFVIRCPMKEKKYTKECADQVIQSLGVDLKKIDECMGDPDADKENAALKAEQEAQIGSESRGDVRILPTVVINSRQYRGKLDRKAVLKAICAGFKETTEPSICLREDIETNQCLENNGGCWHDDVANITACKDTFRGRVCECPTVQGVKFAGDGYTHCEASGALRCQINNGGCWKETQNGTTYSACSDDSTGVCTCPPGFRGDGNSCQDVDECKEKLACQCPECKCKNTWGIYECSCRGGLYYMKENDICINKDGNGSWGVFWIIVLGLTAAGVGGYMAYKYRVRRYMDSEIRSILAQYMPLDSEPQVPAHGSHTNI